MYLALPDIVREVLIPGPQGFSRSDVPPPLVVDGDGRRLLIAAENSAGQGAQWAAALDALPGWTARSLQVPSFSGGFGYSADCTVPPEVFARSRRWGRRQYEALARGGADVVLMESLRPIFGRRFGGDPSRELRALASAGVRTGIIWHGSDVRSPRRHAVVEPHSPLADPDDPWVAQLQQAVDRAVRAADELAVVEFVSTPDLLRDRPAATWLPLAVDTAQWRPVPWAPRRRLRVLHAPSSGRMKGTALIEPVLRRLAAEKVIDLELPSGVAWDRMPELVRGADVVVDQLLLGSYGVAACEAMASGRLVIGHIAHDVRMTAATAAGIEVPIVEATVDTIESVLRTLAFAPDDFRDQAAAGPEFVSRVHDGRSAAAAMDAALGGGGAQRARGIMVGVPKR